MYTCINTYNVLARVIWPATFARSAGPPGGQNGRTDINIYINIYIYRKIIAAVRLGGLAPARPIIHNMGGVALLANYTCIIMSNTSGRVFKALQRLRTYQI